MLRSSSSMTITSEQILDKVRFLSSKDLRVLQTRLTTTNKELVKLADTALVGQLLSEKERDLLRNAAQIVRTMSSRIAAAKEKQQRDEKRLAAELKARQKAANTLVKHAFTLPTDSLPQRLEVIRIALILNKQGVLMSYYSADEFAARLIAQARQTPPDWMTKEQYLLRELRSLANNILDDVQEFIVDNYNIRDAQDGLKVLLLSCEDVRSNVIEKQSATLQVWMDELERSNREVSHG